MLLRRSTTNLSLSYKLSEGFADQLAFCLACYPSGLIFREYTLYYLNLHEVEIYLSTKILFIVCLLVYAIGPATTFGWLIEKCMSANSDVKDNEYAEKYVIFGNDIGD